MKRLRNLLKCSLYLAICLTVSAGSCLFAQEEADRAWSTDPLRALIVDGQNNHGVWPKTTQMMRRYLEETGMFVVDVATSRPDGTDPDFQPVFSDYAVVISNYNGSPWPDETKTALDEYMQNGGGLVIVHAADNSFPGWREFNEMIGLGGWGGRNENSGPYVYYNDEGEEVRDESAGGGGGHGPQHEFAIVIRNDSHPITTGLPAGFMHAKDELYERLRGPAANMTVLATAYASPEQRGTSRHEPMAMTISYGEGRVFHTPMGHADYSMECTGFITMFQRGTEWAATGNVTQEVPEDFPDTEATTQRTFEDQDEASKELAAAIENMIAICETGTGEEIVNSIAHPEDLEQIKEQGELEEVYRELGERKKDRLMAALMAIRRSLIKVEGESCEIGDGRTMKFEKYDGAWYLRN
ncbi:MAG: ThuA domain-containing protein [Planctomycetota bacterium]